MTDHELRALVRDAVARHFGTSRSAAPPPAAPSVSISVAAGHDHASHVQYITLINIGDTCLIEPDVTCTHCGYCKSHGH
jgi:threonine dehydrogenase-like Zn-dependent dehydrogenase